DCPSGSARRNAVIRNRNESISESPSHTNLLSGAMLDGSDFDRVRWASTCGFHQPRIEVTSLTKYDAACRALAEAKATDEVKSVRDKAEAMRVYAHQAKNRQLEIDAAEIRIRAERRLGELIVEQKETVG